MLIFKTDSSKDCRFLFLGAYLFSSEWLAVLLSTVSFVANGPPAEVKKQLRHKRMPFPSGLITDVQFSVNDSSSPGILCHRKRSHGTKSETNLKSSIPIPIFVLYYKKC
jgi:hypothetical protein